MVQAVKELLRVSDIYTITCRSSTCEPDHTSVTAFDDTRLRLPKVPGADTFRREMGGPGREVGQRPRAPRPGAEPVRIGALASGGFEFAVLILAGVFGGWWIDRRIGTGPWLLMVGAFVGAGAGFYRLYRTLTAGQRGPGPRDGDRPAPG
jgi:hypothetical protein